MNGIQRYVIVVFRYSKIYNYIREYRSIYSPSMREHIEIHYSTITTALKQWKEDDIEELFQIPKNVEEVTEHTIG